MSPRYVMPGMQSSYTTASLSEMAVSVFVVT